MTSSPNTDTAQAAQQVAPAANEAATEQAAPAQKRVSSFKLIWGAAVERHGYTALPNIMLRAQSAFGLNTTQFNILAQLLSYYYEPTRVPYPKKSDLAERLGVTPKAIQMNMRKLEKAGFIRREQQVTAAGDWGSNLYHLDGFIAKVQALEPQFAEEKKKREAARRSVEKHQKKTLDGAQK